MMTRERLDYIDAMRGFAILGVVLTHAASKAGLSGPLGILMAQGGYGVQLFFVVSAFTIVMTIYRSRSREARPIRNFYIRRLMRIVPVYWLGIVLYTAVYGVFASHGWRESPGSGLDYIANALLMNVFIPNAMSSVVPGGWSISVEVMFYLTVPLWLVYVKDVRSAFIFTIAAAVIGQVLTVGLSQTFEVAPPTLAKEYWYRGYLSQLSCFGLGMVLYFMTRHRSSALRWHSALWLAGGVVVLAATLMLKMNFPGLTIFHILYAVGFTLIGLALHIHPWKTLVNAGTVWLGRISYSLYLIHFLALDLLNTLVQDIAPEGMIRFLIVAGLGCLVSFPLAYLSSITLEESTKKAAKSLIARMGPQVSEGRKQPA